MNPYSLGRALQFIDPWLDTNVKQQNVPGLVVAICHDQSILFSKAYGLANLTTEEPLRTDHVFSLASQSKMFTATGVMLLAQSGQLDLDAPIVQYLPWLRQHRDPRFRQVTIRQLLWHGAGLLRDGEEVDFLQLESPYPDVATTQQMILDATLVVDNGVKVKYSNLGYALLGQLISAVSGSSYRLFMQRAILEPLGMDSTFVDYQPELQQRLAAGHSRSFGPQRFVLPKKLPTFSLTPATGWHATAEDMCRFMMAQYGTPSLLGKTYRHELHFGTRQHWTLPQDRGTDYGLGFMRYIFGERELVGHSGSFIGHRSCSFFDPKQKLAVVVMANYGDAPTMTILQGVWSVLDYFEKYATQPEPPSLAKFNTRLSSVWATKEIVATNKRICTVYVDEWQPFDGAEELVYVDDATLQVHATSDLMSAGELVKFTFDGPSIKNIIYAGNHMRSEAQVRAHLQAISHAG